MLHLIFLFFRNYYHFSDISYSSYYLLSSMHVLDLNVFSSQQISYFSSNTQATKGLKLSNQLSKVVVTVFVSILLLLGMQSAAFAVLAASEQADQVENSFRKSYPFHIQIIGLTSPLRDQSRVLIISEPPPHIKPEYFQRLVDSLGGKAFVKKHRIGYDGWTKDAVLALPPLSKDKLSNLLTKLHRDLYGTAYKANAVQLPIKPPPASKRSLDLSVSVGDLNNWLNKKNLKFTPTIGGASRSVPEILSSKQSGVFISNQRGLVIWSIPRKQDLANYRAEARQFFLDSDLIVGAIATNNQLAIVARERVEPLLRFPPLRVETALMLAAEESEELAQSYEGLQLFASKLPNFEDWAPIYLSDSLINTDFGSLLNITDQLLKSWSVNGSVKFANFDNYPKPLYWPQFQRPMRELYKNFLKEGSGFIVFNWNTEGAGYTTSIGSYDFFALNRTGALPINYFTKDSSISTNEKIAYDYFSKLGNSDFAQVVQYTALHDIFRKFGITTSKSTIHGSLLPGTKILESEASHLLIKLQAMAPSKLSSMLDENLQVIDQGLQILIQQGKLDSQIGSKFRSRIPKTKESIEQLHKAVNYGTTRWKNIAIPELSLLLASPRTYTPSFSDPDFENWLSSIFEIISTDLELRSLLFTLLNVNVEEVKERYAAAFNDTPKTWIKTPSIALSRDTVDDLLVYGGHNLSSKLTRLKPSLDVPIGKLRVLEKNSVILYNPKDVGKIHGLSRVLKTEAENPNLINSLENVLKKTSGNQRTLPKGLNIPNEQSNLTKPGDRGLTGIHEPPTSSPPLGWRLRDNSLTPDEAQRLVTADTLGTRSIIIERSPNGYAVLRSGNNQAVEAHTIDSFYDDVLPQFMRSMPEDGSPIQIYLNGFTPEEAQALRLTGGLRQEALQPVVFRGKRPFPENIALLKSSYDWKGAVIKEIKVEPFPIGSTSAYRQIIDVEVIPTIPNRPSLRVRIITFLKEFPKEIADRIKAVVQRVLASSQSRSVNQVISDIHKELRKEFPEVDINVQVEAGDIYITEPVIRNRHARRISYDN